MDLPPSASSLAVRVLARGGRSGRPASLDVSAFLLSPIGRVPTDEHFVFYGNPKSPCGGVRWAHTDDGDETLAIDLEQLPRVVDGLVITGSIYEARQNGVSLADIREGRVIISPQSGPVLAEHLLPPVPPGSALDAAILLVLARRGSGWSCRAAGEAVGSGLSGLATSFGVTVD